MLKKFPKTLNDPLTGYVVYLPDDYDKNKKYPTIIFFHGQAEQGNGDAENLYTFINAEWNNFMGSWGLGSNKWILVAPHLITPAGGYYAAAWNESYLKDALRFARQYSIDEDRKILLDVSLGGAMGWLAPSITTEFAGAVNICPIYVQVNFCNIKTPVWALHAADDPQVSPSGTTSAINAINNCNPPIKAKKTILPTGGHFIWGTVLSPVLIPGESMTAWQWMEQQKRGTVTVDPTTPPVIPSPVVSSVKADASATPINVVGTTLTLDASKSSGYKETSLGYADLVWNVISHPEPWDWNIFPNFNKTGKKIALQNLVPGEYIFELTAKDTKGVANTDTVKVTVTKGKQQVGTATVDGKNAILYSDHTWI